MQETRTFNKRMNKDVDVRFLQQGEYIDALNIHVGRTDNGRDGAVENMRGNTLYNTTEGGSIYTMPTGVNRCIGSVEDVVNKRVYWFVFNSEGDHVILMYDVRTSRITELVKDNDYSSSTFSASGSYSANVVLDSGGSYSQLLIDTDFATYSGTQAFANSYLFRPIGNYLNFQETHLIDARVIIHDGQSYLFWVDDSNEPKYANVDMLLGNTAESYPTVLNADCFDVKQASPLFRPAVTAGYSSALGESALRGKYFQFKYRWVNIHGAPTDWSPISVIPDMGYSSFYMGRSFYNYIDVYVGRYSAETNCFYSKIEIVARENGDGNSGDWYKVGEIDANTEAFTSETTSSGDVWGLVKGAASYPHYYTFRFTNTQDRYIIPQDEAESIYSNIPKRAKSIEIINDNRIAYGNTTEGYDISGITTDLTIDNVPVDSPSSFTDYPKKTFKKMNKYQFGIRYSDGKGRVTTVLTDDDYILQIKGTSAGSIYYQLSEAVTIDIGHAPPSWATSWQICYIPVGNMAYEGSTPDFIQFSLSDRSVGASFTNLTAVYGAGNYSPRALDALETFQYDHNKQNRNWVYSYSQGDRMRAYSTGSGDAANDNDNALVLQYLSGGVTYVIPVAASSAELVEGGNGYVMEIYSPASSGTSLWYEIGDAKMCGYDVNGEWAHLSINDDSVSVDQVVGTSDAKTIINDADCYLTYNTMYKPATIPVTDDGRTSLGSTYYETPWIDYSVASRCNDRGRPNIVSSSYGEYTNPNRIRFSQPIVSNTDIIKFTLMYDGDFEDNNLNYGSIQKMWQQDNNLYIFQEKRVGWRPIARQIIEDASSQQLVGISGEIMGDANYATQLNGISTNPESFVAWGGLMFWADVQNKAVCKWAGARGQVENIAESGMKSFFDALFGEAKQYNYPRVFGAFDPEFNKYVMAVKFELKLEGLTYYASSSTYYGFTATTTDVSAVAIAKIWDVGGRFPELPSEVDVFGELLYENASGYMVSSIGDLYADPPYDWPLVDLDPPISASGSARDVVKGCAAVTLLYDPQIDGWTSRISAYPETMTTSGATLVSFKAGEFYRHNDVGDSAFYHNFYNEQFEASIKLGMNALPTQNKVYNTLGLETDGIWRADIRNDAGQRTHLIPPDFEEYEGAQWADIMRDEQNAGGLLEGDYIIDDHAYITLTQNQSGVERVSMLINGTSYTSAPTVLFSGGGGSGAAGEAILSGSYLVGVKMTNNGSGYTSAPTVAFTGGGGTGASGVARLSNGRVNLFSATARFNVSTIENV